MAANAVETTPYAVRETSEGFTVWQEWWNKAVAGPFATKDEAQAVCIAEARRWR
jgi:hypothetical protein